MDLQVHELRENEFVKALTVAVSRVLSDPMAERRVTLFL